MHAANTDLTGTYKNLNSWGFVTLLDGMPIVIALIITVFLWFAWKRCREK